MDLQWCKDHIQRAIDANLLMTRHSVNLLAEIFHSLIRDGPNMLHIVSDFDMTLTRYWVRDEDGTERRNVSSHAIVMQSPLFPKWAVERTEELYKKYYPIELDPNMPKAEKFQHMNHWWEEAHVILQESKVTEQDIRTMCEQSGIVLRDGLHDMICNILGSEPKIPIVVFSAGLANVIEDVLDLHGLRGDHVHVISNHIIFSPNPPHECIRVDPDPPIHVLNKNEASMLHLPDHELLEGRPNVILMGDALGDIEMAAGVQHKTLLSIGFLNRDVNENKKAYLSTFDLVLLQDPSLDFVNQFLLQLIGKTNGISTK